jgi:cell division septation protein DedD
MMMSDMDDTSRPTELTAERRDRPRRFSRGRMLVTLLALIAFSSFTWYAYRQATKAGEEGVAPLIKAEDGPTRVKPDEPGGMDVPHQDKTIFERMGSEQPAQAKVESLLPEPEAPLPRPAAASTPTTVATTTTNVNAPSAQPPVASHPAKAAAANEKTASTQVAAVPPPPPSAAEAKAMAKVAPAAGEPAGAESAPPPPPASETKTAAVEPAPAVASGSYRVQLGALRSQEAADAQWTKLQKTFPDLLSALSLNVQKVDIAGKGTFFRVQAGALSESAAKELCDELKRRKAECIVVKS